MKFSTILKLFIIAALSYCVWLLWLDYQSGNGTGNSKNTRVINQLNIATHLIESAKGENELGNGFESLRQINITSNNQYAQAVKQKIEQLLNAEVIMGVLLNFQLNSGKSFDETRFQLEALQLKTWGRDNATVSEINLLQRIYTLINSNEQQFKVLHYLIKQQDQESLEPQIATIFLQLGSLLEAAQSGNETLGIRRLRSANERQSITAIQESLQTINSQIEQIIANFAVLYEGIDSLHWLQNNAYQLNKASDWEQLSNQVFLIIAVLMILIALIFYVERISVKRDLSNEKKYNDLAISRLLDEIADLSEGDLTVKATVTEDFTGVLADALNYSIEQLQTLASKVNDTAEHVITISHETSASSMQLQQRAEQQYNEMQEYCKGLNEISKSLTQVMERMEGVRNIVESSTTLVSKSVSTLEHGQQIVEDSFIQVSQAHKCVARMLEYCEQIQVILSQFQENSEKIRMTSLNTSLQAAQFGSNRNLVLMTDEIMTLGERMSGGSQQVKNLFAALNTEAKGSLGSLDSLISTFKEHNQSEREMIMQIKQIVEDTEYSSGLMQGLSEKIQNSNMVAQHVASRIQSMEETTFNSLHEITKTSRVVQELANYALGLKKLVAGFKLKSAENQLTDDGVTATSATNDEDEFPSIDVEVPASPTVTIFTDEEVLTDNPDKNAEEQETEESAIPEVMNPLDDEYQPEFAPESEHGDGNHEKDNSEQSDSQLLEPMGLEPKPTMMGRIKRKIDNIPL